MSDRSFPTAQRTHWHAEITVVPKAGVNDPQGASVQAGLRSLGHHTVHSVHVGRFIRLAFSAENEDDAAAQVTKMCETLLANPVIESYSFSVVPQPSTRNQPTNGTTPEVP